MVARRPELLAPAGDMERLLMALAYGADAVYFAGRRFGLRKSAGNFTDEELVKAVGLCHERGARAYVACNAVIRGDDVRALPPYLEFLQEIGADAVILSDLGAFSLARKHAPGLKVHISTQAGVMNSECAKALFDMGASRVILARELTLREIAAIRLEVPPELELEVFVHGSMCVAFSGRCLLSNYLAGRDAGRGDCAQPCRWKYFLVEEKRTREALEIVEDEGTYIFNSRDLCMIGHLEEIMAAGVDSLKIEGRAKSFYYTAVITHAYRHAIDAAVSGKPLSPVWEREVYKVSHRPYSTGFYFSEGGPGEHYSDSGYSSEYDVVAVVEGCDEEGVALLTQRNKFSRGDELELLKPGAEPVTFVAGPIYDEAGEEIEAAAHPMMPLRMKLPVEAPKYSILRRKRGWSGGLAAERSPV